MNNYQIKILAAALMVLDHLGAVFFPQFLVLRILGRFSFPLFGWLLVQGERHTRDWQAYLMRLLALALISQIPYTLLFGWKGNIFFTLALALCALHFRSFGGWLLAAGLAQLLNLDYGAYGIVLIGILQFSSPQWLYVWVLLHFFYALIDPLQFAAVATPLLLLLASGKQGKKIPRFYFFYPGHLLLIILGWFLVKIV